MCRFNIEIGVRIIGSITLIACLVNVFLFPGSIRSLLATDEVRVTLFLKLPVDEIYQRHYDQAEMNLEVLKLFCYLCVISSCLLIWASITCNQFLAIPWLVCMVVDVVFQVVQLAHMPYTQHTIPPSSWVVVEPFLSFLTSFLIMGFVLYAIYHWKTKSEKDRETEDLDSDSSDTSPQKSRVLGGLTKSMSFQVV